MNKYENHLTEIFSISGAEKRNPQSLWNLEDRKFFSAGACHVLAFAYKRKHLGSKIYLIQPKNARGTHVFSAHDEWYFDSYGFQKKNSFLKTYFKVCRTLFGQYWDCDIVEIKEPFEEYCEKYNHRNVSAFLENPFPRAQTFILVFDKTKTSSK